MSSPVPVVDYAPVNRMEYVAAQIRKLSYEEFMELAAAIETSPAALHRWSKERD